MPPVPIARCGLSPKPQKAQTPAPEQPHELLGRLPRAFRPARPYAYFHLLPAQPAGSVFSLHSTLFPTAASPPPFFHVDCARLQSQTHCWPPAAHLQGEPLRAERPAWLLALWFQKLVEIGPLDIPDPECCACSRVDSGPTRRPRDIHPKTT